MNIALFGATAAVHDHVDHVEHVEHVVGARDFDAVCAQLEAGPPVVVTTGVTRSNARNLAAIAQFLSAPRRRPKVAAWTLAWPGPQPKGLALPRLAMVAPRVLHAAALGRKGGLTVFTAGLPLCVLGPHTTFAAPTDPRAYGPPCDTCPSKTGCSGVPAAYLEAFGRDLELRATR